MTPAGRSWYFWNTLNCLASAVFVVACGSWAIEAEGLLALVYVVIGLLNLYALVGSVRRRVEILQLLKKEQKQ
jgi:hypothetical protein